MVENQLIKYLLMKFVKAKLLWKNSCLFVTASLDARNIRQPMRVFVERHKTTRITRARFDLTESDLRSKSFYFKHNLIDSRFTPVGLCSNKRPVLKPIWPNACFRCGEHALIVGTYILQNVQLLAAVRDWLSPDAHLPQ